MRRIAAGGIPAAAERRLSVLGGEAGQAFTSDLSVSEFALIRRHGLEPLTQVMGTSLYHVGWQYINRGMWGSTSQELTTLSDAYNDCRVRALARLRQEAELAGAGAVVGVRITTARYDWAHDLLEFQAIGTAVRAPDMQTPNGPALTNLSGQDVALLLDSGYTPLGVVGATSVHFGQLWMWGQPMPFGTRGMWSVGNVEYEGATRTWYAARHTVLAALRGDAAALGASGLIGTEWGQEERPYESNDTVSGVTYTLHALATAIAGDGAPPKQPTTSLYL
ncbi:MAG: heavy metal-binding domain-containing protein [Gaiellales bacterium]